MRRLSVSIAITACALAFSAGAAIADNLHELIPNPNLNPHAATAAPGQTGSNVLASCGATSSYFSIGAGQKITNAPGSPFNPNAVKKYAGNPGNPATNPKAVSQYDNACAQAALHQMP